MSKTVRYENVNKIFGLGTKNQVHALKDISFTIEEGELFCLLGPSGCGKTTLLRNTAGLDTITSGKMYYGDVDISTIPPYKRNIGMVFQSYALYPHMSIFENVAYGLRVRKVPNDIVTKKVTEVMELVGLQEELKRNPSPTALSGGQQQRVAIARALVYDPDVLLLDEPLANLDAKLRRYMRAEIRRIQKATNITTIFVTHDQEEAMAVGDRLAVLRKGVVEQIGTSDELYNKPRNAFVANFIGKMNFFNAHVIESGPRETIAEIDTTGIRIAIKDEKRHVEPKAGDEVLIGGRPEYLAVSSEPTDKSIPGVVRIIQHLGSFIRYEVEISRDISPVTLEIDMDSLQKDIREGDSVNVTFDGSRVALFSPEGREL